MNMHGAVEACTREKEKKTDTVIRSALEKMSCL